jgi:hypothetical protein
MSRVSSLSSPFLLGFDEIERVLDRVGKAAEGYPPYNIERIPRDGNSPERLRITLAVAGFTRDQLDVSVEESQLVIRGRQQDDKSRQYIHRGIAARQCLGLAYVQDERWLSAATAFELAAMRQRHPPRHSHLRTFGGGTSSWRCLSSRKRIQSALTWHRSLISYSS